MTEVQIANLALSYIGGRPITSLGDTSQQAVSLNQWFDTARDEALKSHPWNFASARARSTTTWKTVTGAADNGSGLIRITSAAHGLSTGDRITIKDVGGIGNAVGQFYVTVIGSGTFDLQDSTFTGTYTSGGQFVKIPLFGWSFAFDLPADFLVVRTVNGHEANEEDSVPYEIQGTQILLDCDTLELRYTFQEDDTTKWTQDFIAIFAALLASYVAQDITGPAGKAVELRQRYEQLVSKIKATDAQQGKGRILDPGWDSPAIRARQFGYRGPFIS